MSEIESVRHEGYCYLDINRMAARSPHFNGSTGPLLTITPEGELQFGEGVGPKEAAAAIAEAFKEELAGIVKAAAAEQSTRDAAIFDELRALCAPGAEALPDGVRLTRIIQVLDPLLAPERAARMPNAVEAAIPSVPAFAAYHPGVGIVPETCVATAAQVMHHMGSLYRDGDEISADGWPRAAAAGWRVEPVVIAPGSTDTDPAAARLTEEAEAFLRRRPRSGPGRRIMTAAPPTPTETLPYIYRWDRHGRKGQPCKVTARGSMNSCRVEFVDGYIMITSRNAVRKATTVAMTLPLAALSEKGRL